MIQAINFKDEFLVSKDRITLIEKQLHIPGLRMIGHHTINTAVPSSSWHYHADAFEFSIPVNGTFSFETPDKAYSFSAGDVFVSFPNEIHGTNQSPFPPGNLYWFQLDISDPDHFLFLCPETAHELIQKLGNLPHHIVHIEKKLIFPLIEQAFASAYKENNSALTAAYLVLLLNLVLSFIENNSSHVPANIQKTLDYIQENIYSELTLEELADIAALSCSQYKKNFKNTVGISPRNYINKGKIEKAKELLLHGMSVTETAMYLNFTSSNYFSSVFKKYTSTTPLEYIKIGK